jgi:hypothetical protein
MGAVLEPYRPKARPETRPVNLSALQFHKDGEESHDQEFISLSWANKSLADAKYLNSPAAWSV